MKTEILVTRKLIGDMVRLCQSLQATPTLQLVIEGLPKDHDQLVKIERGLLLWGDVLAMMKAILPSTILNEPGKGEQRAVQKNPALAPLRKNLACYRWQLRLLAEEGVEFLGLRKERAVQHSKTLRTQIDELEPIVAAIQNTAWGGEKPGALSAKKAKGNRKVRRAKAKRYVTTVEVLPDEVVAARRPKLQRMEINEINSLQNNNNGNDDEA